MPPPPRARRSGPPGTSAPAPPRRAGSPRRCQPPPCQEVGKPPERVLAETHGVSRITIRQAVHKLAAAGLVEVRQGGPTRVRDPAKADARVLELLLRFGGRLRSARANFRRDLEEYSSARSTMAPSSPCRWRSC
ncbi:FadR/GntR family transcriptional regulator [Sorangium cellulosum]